MANSLDSVFQGIYKSIVEAQNVIEQHYVGEIKEDIKRIEEKIDKLR